jgi:hypothetical protein
MRCILLEQKTYFGIIHLTKSKCNSHPFHHSFVAQDMEVRLRIQFPFLNQQIGDINSTITTQTTGYKCQEPQIYPFYVVLS